MAKKDITSTHFCGGSLFAHQALHIKPLTRRKERVFSHTPIRHRLGTPGHHLGSQQPGRFGHVGIETRQLAVEDPVQQRVGAVKEGGCRNAVIQNSPGQFLLKRLEGGGTAEPAGGQPVRQLQAAGDPGAAVGIGDRQPQEWQGFQPSNHLARLRHDRGLQVIGD